ncbi:RNA polymerase sigma-70 factor [Puteibacter caeruleilacunae]|nr:RNA polymerase sigma-70 factor [Puteibacter caeruleilacunae]
MNFEEKLILNEIRQGNDRVYEALFRKHYAMLVNFANQYVCDLETSEDIVQGVFMHFWVNAKNVDIDISIKSYLFQAVKFQSANHLRTLEIRDKHELFYLEGIVNSNDDSLLQDSEIIEQVKKALKALPDQMHDIFYKKYFQDMSVKEIAEELSLSANTVKVQLFNGRNKIREYLRTSTGIYFFL